MPCWLTPAGTLKPFAVRATNPQVLSSHLVLQMPCELSGYRYLLPCGLPIRRYFQAIWCFKCPARCRPTGVLSGHLVFQMPSGLSTHRYSQAILVLQMPCGMSTHRYFRAIWCLTCPAGCQSAGAFKPLAATLEMPCGLPSRRYFPASWCRK